ncbi:carbonic anhydrase 2-like isoform X1 [Toxorhynchites rutilus septentrionalis]|uniref:carbonic anhydrase 2-like isoform X1 n=1 Tax=Toxorhynchites rutilus septentrionalis TaxID=329112 RepID=UPI00247A266C|nr:carbonic anhydrase 2-like isoform X1 [Toxorhynchites rutilus septentrionalis]
MQSPIALSTRDASPRAELQPLELLSFEIDPTEVTVRNDGHTVIYTFQWPNGQSIVARGGPLEGEFQLDSIHFHWGAASGRGAEHVIDERRREMEVHMVFYSRKYESFQQAKTQTDGLAVLAFIFTTSASAPKYGWIPALNEVQQAGASYTLPNPSVFNIQQLIGTSRRPYFCYRGSLTVAPYHETVNWVVHERELLISEDQLDMFRSLRAADGTFLRENHRPLQTSNDRTVFYYR